MSEQKKRPTVGLALGGGSARGFAHIGVIRALQESRIPIDVVSGCSIGAIIGSVFCVGGDLELLLKICMQMKAREMMDLVVPRKGMVRGAKFENLIQLFTKNRDFEEMDVPFACSACDLWEGKTKIFTTGKVYPAVRASMSIPGVFEPKLIDGVMYVDGGVLDNVPVDAAKRLGADVVIGSDVCGAGTAQRAVDRYFIQGYGFVGISGKQASIDGGGRVDFAAGGIYQPI